jgi:hypothetical protein
MKPRIWIVFTLTMVTLGLPLGAAGADTPCAADIQKLCSDVAAGGGRIQACLKQNETQVSQACRAKIDVLGQEIKEIALVCRWDIGRLCSDVSPGDGRLAACLNTHASDLSPECKAALASTKK